MRTEAEIQALYEEAVRGATNIHSTNYTRRREDAIRAETLLDVLSGPPMAAGPWNYNMEEVPKTSVIFLDKNGDCFCGRLDNTAPGFVDITMSEWIAHIDDFCAWAEINLPEVPNGN